MNLGNQSIISKKFLEYRGAYLVTVLYIISVWVTFNGRAESLKL